MEALVPSKVSSIGLSNIDLVSLCQVYEFATIKLNAVQNRFTQDTMDRPDPTMPSNLPYPLISFDRDVREYCQQNGIVYAPWGELWGSLDVLDGPEHILEKAGNEVGVSKEIACYACLRSLGGCKVSILCGTSNEGRMRDTLEGLVKIQKYLEESDENMKTWKGFINRFKEIVDGGES